eukprot:CAMPEP_0197608096 /NCGR_PEP_ID=MMETSP1326-20131121/48372_1 /TAXON_ID=1155430 /ORGANISM="Genus nov. species nov., Strain RCC2288" /LENGTH=47 /DNA_ID= /DNA_START= /DNA_END= /DNA_ORIENTATION=
MSSGAGGAEGGDSWEEDLEGVSARMQHLRPPSSVVGGVPPPRQQQQQ